MDKCSSKIDDYRAITKTLAINSSFNTIAGYCRIDNIRGSSSSIVTGTVSASSKCSNKAISTSVSTSERSAIAGCFQITGNSVPIDIGNNNRLRTISDGDNCLMQAHIILPEIAGLFISSN